MELFIPSLIVLVLVAVFAFLIIPRSGPMILAIASLIALIAAGVHHYNLFAYEYQLSTWQNGLASYAPFIVLGLALLVIIGGISFVFMGSETKAKVTNAVAAPLEQIQNAVQNSIKTMPNATSATNPLTAALNRGISAVTGPSGPVSTAPELPANSGQLLPGFAPRQNQNQQRSPLIPGLGFRASEV
jgi:hypothetical protein